MLTLKRPEVDFAVNVACLAEFSGAVGAGWLVRSGVAWYGAAGSFLLVQAVALVAGGWFRRVVRGGEDGGDGLSGARRLVEGDMPGLGVGERGASLWGC